MLKPPWSRFATYRPYALIFVLPGESIQTTNIHFLKHGTAYLSQRDSYPPAPPNRRQKAHHWSWCRYVLVVAPPSPLYRSVWLIIPVRHRSFHKIGRDRWRRSSHHLQQRPLPHGGLRQSRGANAVQQRQRGSS